MVHATYSWPITDSVSLAPGLLVCSDDRHYFTRVCSFAFLVLAPLLVEVE